LQESNNVAGTLRVPSLWPLPVEVGQMANRQCKHDHPAAVALAGYGTRSVPATLAECGS
jgi:hypothetical protein